MRKKATILQVLPSLHSGGVERGTIDLANALVKEGFKSLVVSSGGPMVEELIAKGSNHIKLPVHSKNPWVMWRNQFHLINIAKKHHVDLFHVRSRAPAWSVFWASRRSGIPFITTFHGAYGHKNRLKRWYNSAMLRGSQTIAVSKFIKQHIESTYPTFAHNIQTIYRGIDFEQFEPITSLDYSESLPSNWQLNQHKKTIILPGRLTRIKGHTLLLEALQKLDTSMLQVLFVGDEPGKDNYRNELLDKIDNLNLSDVVRLLGHCSDMRSVYAIADIIVSATTKPESFGRVACEAQAMEKLVVASNHGGSQETIAPAMQDLLFKPNNVESLANALQKALSLSSKDAAHRGHEARQFIKQNYTLDKMTTDTIKLYDLQLALRA